MLLSVFFITFASRMKCVRKTIRKEMKLSLITINYNNAAGLRRTLDSVATQRVDAAEKAGATLEVEHIIIDGNSTDESMAIIRDYEQHILSLQCGQLGVPSISLTWVFEPDAGIYNAMNKGIEVALGIRKVDAQHHSYCVEDNVASIGVQKMDEYHHYIQILNSGDLLAADNVIARMYNALRREDSGPYPEILYGNMLKAMSNGKLVRDNCGGAGVGDSFLYFYRGTLNHDCAWIHSELFRRFGFYDEEMKICSDWKWYVDAIALGGVKTVYVNIDVTIFDMNGISESGGKNKEQIRQERSGYLEDVLPTSVLNDYKKYAFPISQYERLRKYHIYGVVYLVERILFKLEKWGILK